MKREVVGPEMHRLLNLAGLVAVVGGLWGGVVVLRDVIKEAQGKCDYLPCVTHDFYSWWTPNPLGTTHIYQADFEVVGPGIWFYSYYVDGSPLIDPTTGGQFTYPGNGWSPNQFDANAETHDPRDQMPGGTQSPAWLNNALYLVPGGGPWNAITSPAAQRSNVGNPVTSWYGVSNPGNSANIWDYLCT